MSRSRKHIPIGGWTGAPSEKEFKQKEHRRERHKVKEDLLVMIDDVVLPDSKKYGNRWAGPKDGRGYFGHLEQERNYDKLMRK